MTTTDVTASAGNNELQARKQDKQHSQNDPHRWAQRQ